MLDFVGTFLGHAPYIGATCPPNGHMTLIGVMSLLYASRGHNDHRAHICTIWPVLNGHVAVPHRFQGQDFDKDGSFS